MVGLPSWWLQQAGLLTWSDLFDGSGEVRDFDLVVERQGLTVDQFLCAGVPEALAPGRLGLFRWGGDPSPQAGCPRTSARCHQHERSGATTARPPSWMPGASRGGAGASQGRPAGTAPRGGPGDPHGPRRQAPRPSTA